METSNIIGKVIVITGASSGIGESTAKLLAAQGARVVLGARRQNRIDAVVKEISASGGKAIGFSTDVTKRSEVEALIQGAVDGFGRIDVLVNNAGIMPTAPIEALKVDEWGQQPERICASSTKWLFRLTQALARSLTPSGNRPRWKLTRSSSGRQRKTSNGTVNYAPFLLDPLAPILASFSYGAGGCYDVRNISTACPRPEKGTSGETPDRLSHDTGRWTLHLL